MMLHPVRVLRAAIAVWRRDRSILAPLAGLFLFIPQWAILLLVPEVPAPGDGDAEAAAAAWSEAFSTWLAAHGGAYVAAGLAAQFGTLAVAALYLGVGAGQAGTALRRAAAVFGRYLIAALLVWAPLIVAATVLVAAGGTGAAMLAAPVLYIAALALLALVAPAVTAGPGGAVAAVARAWAAARGHRGALAATVGLIVVTSQLGSVVLLSLARALRVGGADNPVVLVVLDAGAAAMLAGGALLIALAGVVVYRALAK